MIISPSISEILRGVIHEMGTTLKQGLEDPVKQAQIDTMIGVLSGCAVRSDHEQSWINDEVKAICEVANEFVASEHKTKALTKAVNEFNSDDPLPEQYQKASEILSQMGDLGNSVGDDLSNKVWTLMEQRLLHESYIIGGGFEAAGRS